ASTSGWAWKYPGRLGDTPIIGAGSYADTRHGAAACTHTGEMTIRAGTARAIVLYLKLGYALEEAVAAALDDLKALKAGQPGSVAGLAAATSANAGKLDDIQKAGTIRVGIALTGEPIGFRDAQNNPTGYDVVVAQRLADALKVKLEITEVSGAVRITMLQSGQ